MIVPYISRPAPYDPISADSWLSQRGLGWSTAGAAWRLRKFWLPAGVSGAAARWATEAEWEAQFTAAGTASRTYVDVSGTRRADLAANALRYTWINGFRQLLLENAATNAIINSDVVATQSLTVTAAQRTLSFYGTGTVTLSGAATGSLVGTGAANRVSLPFTPSAGTLTLTVSGSVLYGQLELGGYASSYIPTGAFAVTRPVETFRLPAAAEAVVQGGAGTMVVRGQLLTTTVANARVLGGVFPTAFVSYNLPNRSNYYTGSNLFSTFASGDFTTGFGCAVTFDATTRSASSNGGAVAALTEAPGDRGNVLLSRDSSGNQYANALHDLVALGPTSLTNTQLQAVAVPYV